MENKSFNEFFSKIVDFHHRFFRIQIFQNIILLIAFILFFGAIITILEYFLWLSGEIRFVMIMLVATGAFAFLILGIIVPFISYFRKIGYDKIKLYNTLITDYFPEIKDNFINLIELKNIENNLYSDNLLNASIEQKSRKLSVFNFRQAIPTKQFKRIVLLTTLLICAILTISFINKNIFFEGSKRLIFYHQNFTKPSPFQYLILNDNFNVANGDNYNFSVQFIGDIIPERVAIQIGSISYLLTAEKDNIFKYEFLNIQNNIKFGLFASGILLQNFEIKTFPSPFLTQFQIKCLYPSYTQKSKEIIQNITELTVPAGTLLQWNFNAMFTDTIKIKIDSDYYKITGNNNNFNFSKHSFKSYRVELDLINKFIKRNNLLEFNITVIPDLYPEISVNMINDSVNRSVFYYQGMISDDYGFKSLKMVIVDNISDTVFYQIPFSKISLKQYFYYAFDFSISYSQSNFVQYQFCITDNDSINNYKSTYSESFFYKPPTLEHILSESAKDNESLMNNISQLKSIADKIQNNLNSIKRDIQSNKASDWEIMNQLRNINKLNDEFNHSMNKVKSQYENLKNLNLQQNDLIKKYEQLQDLLNNIMDEDIKKLMDELKKLAENFDKSKINDLLDKSKISYKSLEDQLDRNLELYKKLKIENNLEKIANQFNKLSEKEKELVSQMNSDSLNTTKDKQEQINTDYNLLKKLFNETYNENQNLTSPLKIDNPENTFKESDQQILNDSIEMNQDDVSKIKENKNKLSRHFKEIAQKISDMLDNNTLEQNAEDAELIRLILENLLKLSFDQEDIIAGLDNSTAVDPRYRVLVSNERKLLNSFKFTEDSIKMLAKRNSSITSFISKELSQIAVFSDKVMKELEEGKIRDGKASGQYLMTSFNNLVLMLSESLKNIQDNMAMGGAGKGKCKKPKSGKPGLDGLKQQQNALKDQLNKLLKDLKNGNQPGGNTSKQISEMLARQEMFQQSLNSLMNSSEIGSEASELLKQINQLIEQSKHDLINKNINPLMLQRMDLIKSKLFEAEKAEKERDEDDRRQSNENKNLLISNPKSIFEYNKEINNFNDLFKFEKLYLQPFYKKKFDQYIYQINFINE